MTTAITKWGNSRGVRIPKPFLDSLNLKDSDTVELTIMDDTLVIRKSNQPKPKTIEERFEEFYGTDFETALKENPYDCHEISWGAPVGDEVW